MSVERKRHIVKAITWRVVGTIATFFIGWISTGDWRVGLSISTLDFVVKLVLYYGHERLWYKSKFGVSDERDKVNR
jgi:uncharacterized membrane protein